jgi:hypothetical protein
MDNNFEQVEVTNKLLLEMVKNQKENFKNFVKVFIIVIVCYTAILITTIVGFVYYESQFDVTSETVTETTLTTEGENANINNVTDGNMYNDNAIHNEK